MDKDNRGTALGSFPKTTQYDWNDQEFTRDIEDLFRRQYTEADDENWVMPETTFELTKEELPQNGMIPKEYKAVWGEKKLNM